MLTSRSQFHSPVKEGTLGHLPGSRFLQLLLQSQVGGGLPQPPAPKVQPLLHAFHPLPSEGFLLSPYAL